MTSQNANVAQLDREEVGLRPRRVWSPTRKAAEDAADRRRFHEKRIAEAESETQERWQLAAWISAELKCALRRLSWSDLMQVAIDLNKRNAKGSS
ncbi:MAG TPA: hypothetical protein VK453_25560 [Micromonosporaceae bacterium]|nr:hypothetical protein [Micromonosporaceae bacterium]